MRLLLAGIALAALAVSAAHAEPGKGQGQGGGGGHQDKGAHAEHASPGKGGGGNTNKGSPESKGPDKGGPDMARKAERADSPKGNPDRPKFVTPVGNDKQGGGKSDNARDRDDRGKGPDRRDDDLRVVITHNRGDRFAPVIRRRVEYRNFVEGCPPGLAKKFNGCMPPGLAKQRYESRYYYRPDWWGFPLLGGGRYYYRDGFLLRIDAGDRIGAFIPLLGGALAIGNVWPTYYEPVPLAPYYVDYYDLGPRGAYRYADGVIYDVDPETAAIVSIAALLTGDQFRVGAPMPVGYDVYNVPYAYRDRYYDRPGAHYRYADGYIYEIDPETMLIASAISLIA